MKLKVLVLLASLFIASPVFAVFAAPGELDPTFNGTGIIASGLPGGSAGATVVVIQPDGKILVSGTGVINSLNATRIMRFNPNGTLDTTFGTGGSSYLYYPDGSTRIASDMAIEPDGKIILPIGEFVNGQDSCGATRLNSDGSIDLNFGDQGRAAISVANRRCSYWRIKSQPDGKVIVIGTLGAASLTVRDFGVFRFNQDGSPDMAFDGAGYTVTDFGNTDDEPGSVELQPDGKIIVLGNNLQHGHRDHDLARYDKDGTLDSSFGVGGKLVFGDPAVADGNFAMRLQADGKIVIVGGNANNPVGFKMLRLNQDGSMDNSFGVSGAVYTSTAENGSYGNSAIAIQADGRIILGGGALIAGSLMNYTDFGVARYNSNGTLDRAPAFNFGRKESVLSSFWSANGMSRVHFGDTFFSQVYYLAIDPAGRVLAYGRGVNQMALVRFQGDASPYASVSGTVRTAGGLPIRNAYVTLSGGSLSSPVTVLTNNLGIYQFTNLPVTETYNVTATAKRFRFTTGEKTVMLNADTENFDFTANQ